VITENVAVVKEDDDSIKAAFDSFIKSNSHRKNILSSKFKWTAVSISKGRNRKLYICQIFWGFR